MLAVILYHANKDWLPGGFIGVDIFLVISGFLVTSIVLRQQRENLFTFISFYISRIKRIVPAYLVLLAVITLPLMVLLIPQDFNSYMKSLIAALYFNSNHFFANEYDYFGPAVYELPLLHTWSLAVEMQFYVLLPAILVLIPQRFLRPTLLTATGLILAYSSFRISQGHREVIYFSLTARIPEFLLGSLFALQPSDQNWNNRTSNLVAAFGMLLILWSCRFITETTVFPGLSALPPCIGAIMLIAASKSAVNRWISLAVLVWIGNISYSLYLWHWPILAGFRYFFDTYDLPVSALLSFAVLTVVCSYLSYRYVELPFRQRKSAASLVRISALAAGALIITGMSHLINPRLVNPLPAALTRHAMPPGICHNRIIGDCFRGDKSADRTILMLGDSHAAQLNYFADEVGNSIPAKIRVISASSCVPILGFDFERIAEQARAPCLSQAEKVMEYMQSSDTIIIAGLWRLHYGSLMFMKALDRFISEAAAGNRTVIVLAQIPALASNVQRAHRLEQLGLPHADAALNNEWKLANNQVQKLVKNHKNAVFLNLTDDKFFANAPFENGVLMYRDKNYLNEGGSHRYGEVASPYFKKLFDGISGITVEPGPNRTSQSLPPPIRIK